MARRFDQLSGRVAALPACPALRLGLRGGGVAVETAMVRRGFDRLDHGSRCASGIITTCSGTSGASLDTSQELAVYVANFSLANLF